MIIQPLSDPKLYAAGGKFEATPANFPSCKLFFPCNEASGGTTLTDVMQGAVYTTPAFTASAGGITLPNGSYPSITLPNAIAMGTRKSLLLMVGNFGSGSSISVTDTAGTALIALAASASSSVVTNGANTANAGSFTAGSIRGFGVTGHPGQATEAQRVNSTLTSYTALAAVAATPAAITTLPSFTMVNIFNIADFVVYGIAFFVFEAAPTDAFIQDVVMQTGANWQNNRKWLPPILKGVA